MLYINKQYKQFSKRSQLKIFYETTENNLKGKNRKQISALPNKYMSDHTKTLIKHPLHKEQNNNYFKN